MNKFSNIEIHMPVACRGRGQMGCRPQASKEWN